MSFSNAAVIDELTVVTAGDKPLLRRASLRLVRGQITGLTGPSGAGKTTLLRSLLGTLPPGAVRTAGSVEVCGQDVLLLKGKERQRFRHQHLAFVAQDPGSCLNPTMKVRSQLREAARKGSHTNLAQVLDQVQLSERFLRRRPGELSGGQQRRVALARALVRGVDVLLVDEPLAGLQGPLRREIVKVLRSLVRDGTVAIAVTGHHVDLETELADSVVHVAPCSMDTESCSTAVKPIAPQVARPRASQSSVGPGGNPGHPRLPDAPLLAGCGLRAWSGKSRILHGIDFAVPAGAVTAMMGASGAGKTTLVRVLAGLHHEASGRLELAGEPLPISARRRSGLQRARIQYIPQNPLSTLNPHKTVYATIERPLRRLGYDTAKMPERISEIVKSVGLEDSFFGRYPWQLSGGQRQRVAIARALAASPDVLVCDEITSALDAKTAKSIMRTLRGSVRQSGLSLVMVSHEVDEIREYSDYVHVIADGTTVESGATGEVLGDPESHHTRDLLV